MGALIDLTGKRFGRLTVVERVEDHIQRSGQRKTQWLCKCDCENNSYVIVQGVNLKNGHIKSCGCYAKDFPSNYKHGQCDTRLYSIWADMKQRCYDINQVCYKNYGGRGIVVCPEWHSFLPFYNWAIETGYEDDLEIERINNDGNYEPSNCRWATQTEQANNKRNNIVVSYNGKTQTLAQWSKELGMNYKKLYARLYQLNWTTEKALTTP